MPDSNDIKIAVLEEQLKGIRYQQKAHAERTETMFTRLFEQIDILKQAMSQGRGVFAASLFFASAIGGFISLAAQWFFWGHK